MTVNRERDEGWGKQVGGAKGGVRVGAGSNGSQKE